MGLINKLYNIIMKFLSFFTMNSTENEESSISEEEGISEGVFEETQEVEIDEDEKVNVAKRTLLSKLYWLEQEISIFEKDFPEKYQSFMEKIEKLRETYNSSLEEISKLVTFEIDPENSWSKKGEVTKLENEIKRFLEKEVKFSMLSNSIQRLILKLNILYNTSIAHSNEDKKVMSQIRKAFDVATKFAKDLKGNDYILADEQLKERIVNLLSYADYQILKTSIRNSNESLEELISKLVMVVEFEEFDYENAFKAFVKDEITDLGDLLTLIDDNKCCDILRRQAMKLLSEITYSEKILNRTFWNDFLSFESCLLEELKVIGVEKEKVRVNIIVRMDVKIDEDDVLVLPKTNAYLELIKIYSLTQNPKILLLIKVFKNLSQDVTYKEIYFLLLLFDAIKIIEKTPNELFKHIEKFIKEYGYDEQIVSRKKDSLKKSSNKDYTPIFILDDYEEEVLKTLESLNIDFKVMGDNVLINSFYFEGLDKIQFINQ